MTPQKMWLIYVLSMILLLLAFYHGGNWTQTAGKEIIIQAGRRSIETKRLQQEQNDYARKMDERSQRLYDTAMQMKAIYEDGERRRNERREVP